MAHQNVAPAARHLESSSGLAHRGTPPTPSAAATKLANPGTETKGKTVPNTPASKLATPNKPTPNTPTTTTPTTTSSGPNKGTPNTPTTTAAGQNKGTPNTPTTTAAGQNKGAPNTPTTTATGQNKGTPNTATPNTPNVVGQGAGNRERNAAHEQARAQIYAGGRKPVLQNPSFVEAARRDPAARDLARATFRGRLAELNGFRDRDRDRFEERRRFRGIVLGWVGPVFWPYAYNDFVDYTFWPYASDTFWPYAYDDVYDGIFGGYAPDSSAYASVPVRGRREASTETRRRLAAVGLPATGAAEVCSAQASGLTDWPIEQIAQRVQPDDAQRTLLDQLRDATAKAVSLLQGSCPTDLPSTPTGRMTEMRQRIQTMLQAVQLVRPALERFYQSLSDEQKERFNAIDIANSSAARPARSNTRQPDLTQACSSRATQATNLPSDRIAQVLQLDDGQRTALESVKAASAKAADLLSQNCPQDQPLTPTGRLAAIEQRLNAMLQALDTVQPALAKFYNSLSDEQKARFNRLPRQA
ncbi:MAG TPA: Spy/CpxP family protein refolding chaperone [Xanthobacteraceae bacterium]